jgi:hypothetical protein
MNVIEAEKFLKKFVKHVIEQKEFWKEKVLI